MPRLSKQERLAIRERLRQKLADYSFEDIVALVADLVPKRAPDEVRRRLTQPSGCDTIEAPPE